MPGKTEPVEHAGTKGFEQDVCPAQEFGEGVSPVGGFQVQPADALAAVEMAIDWRNRVAIAAHEAPHRVAIGWLDLDYVSAEVDQLTSGEGTWNVLR